MFSKINVSLIVSDHLNTLRNFANGKVYPGDIVLFLVLPAAVALLLVFGIHFTLDVPAINVLITSLSVFSALLFNLLILIYDVLRKEKGNQGEQDVDQEQATLRRQFLGQISTNISFCILVAVMAIALVLLLFIEVHIPYVTDVLNVVIDILVINFILTMLMILKRVHILITTEVPPVTPE